MGHAAFLLDRLASALPRPLDQPLRKPKPRERVRVEHHHEAEEDVGDKESPFQQGPQNDPELDHQVRRSDQEQQRVHRVGTFCEDGPGGCEGCEGAGG